MFWNSNKEINKVINRYGAVKGAEFLTYFYTYIHKVILLEPSGSEAKNYSNLIVQYVLHKHGEQYLKEYSDFFLNNLQNKKLTGELVKTGNTYLNESIWKWKMPEKKPEPAVVQKAEVKNEPKVTEPKVSEPKLVPVKDDKKDLSKHLSCKYEGHEDDCPDDCSKCAISIKTDGDLALASNRLDDAIKFYKKAVFVEPKFAEAWNNMGNAYGMKSEYNNALNAFNKAIEIDPVYEKALYGKAITLRNLGKLDEAMTLANEILEMYEDPNVTKFKADLVSAGVQDKGRVIDAEKAKNGFVNCISDIFEKNDLLQPDGSVPIIRDIYQPEDFLPRVLDYCKRKYASLGEKKVHGEIIITSFYGSMCATIFYNRDKQGIMSTSVFDYLNDHIDIEFTDVNAEKMLGIKEDQAKADAVWEIVSPYVGFCQMVFNMVDELTDEIMIEAMMHAYVLGMCVAQSILSGPKKKHVLGSRAEIDRALARLAESSKDYQDPPPESAMCYSMRVPEETQMNFRCDGCGRTASVRVYLGQEHSIIPKYRELANEFVKLGHKARILCFCDTCAKSKYPSDRWTTHNFVFEFIAKGSNKPVYSFPPTWDYKDFDYNLALLFLKGTDTVSELAEETKSKLNAENYISNIKEIVGDVN